MPDGPRIDELRRRVQANPASIAFAALAEEYRRAGLLEEAIATCRAGLQRHPSYLSARVTLGRALLDAGHDQEAQEAFEQVLRSAPENLAAVRGLAEIHQRSARAAEAAPPVVQPDDSTAVDVPIETSAAAHAAQSQKTAGRPAGIPTSNAGTLRALGRLLDGVERVRRSRTESLPA